jgi:hypothetical protein
MLLKLAFEAGAGVCLWAADAAARQQLGYAVALSQLPISAALRQRGEALICHVDSSIDWNDPGGSSPWDAPTWRDFQQAATDFAAGLRAELGPGVGIIDASAHATGAA